MRQYLITYILLSYVCFHLMQLIKYFEYSNFFLNFKFNYYYSAFTCSGQTMYKDKIYFSCIINIFFFNFIYL